MSLRHMSRICLRAFQWLKGHNSKGIVKPSQARPKSESEQSTDVRRVSGMVVETAKKVKVDEKQRMRREAEKAENNDQAYGFGLMN
ncbi:unnamed protein product [Ilex paraguariensis]|uniref:Uncharacterized protein n=1 Tax=Ilex paraguariensis TaxID=185542 RepID=A0ABC8RRT7_9AQUA